MKEYIKIRKLILIILVTGSISIIESCKKFIEVDTPITSVNRDNVYKTNNNAIAVLTGIYTKMASSQFSLNFSIYPELSADNLTLFDQTNSYAALYYKNQLISAYPNSAISIWNDLYSYIYYCNDAIEGLNRSNTLSPNVKQRLLGEAYFLRGFYYYYLVNLFGSPPLVLSTDYTITSVLTNSSEKDTYTQIVSDLSQAELLLGENYVDGGVIVSTNEKVRPNKYCASAVLARVYLSMKNYVMAESESSKVIAQKDTYSISSINDVFLKNSSESIWSLQPVASNKITMEGDFYIYSSNGPDAINFTYLSSSLINSFEKGDLRSSHWVSTFTNGSNTYYYPFKYKAKNGDPTTASEYTVVLRLAEQYLIRAEARIQQGNIMGGLSDLNLIRKRSRADVSAEIPNPLPDLSDLGKKEALDAVLHERRVELFTEWGNRWIDLKRSNFVDQIMTIETQKKGGVWKNFQSLYPIPLGEIRNSPNLKQNPGYN